MRLSEFAAAAKAPEAVAPKVLATLTPILVALGAGEDPEGWLTWTDEQASRWTYLAPTPAGLVTCHVRVNVPGEGPRTSAKVSRWSRVQRAHCWRSWTRASPMSFSDRVASGRR